MELLEKYRYIIFEDELGKVFVIRDCQLKDCLFAGSVGELREVERGIIERPENNYDSSYYLGAIIAKKNEYLARMSKKIK
jgi:hypothetical protein